MSSTTTTHELKLRLNTKSEYNDVLNAFKALSKFHSGGSNPNWPNIQFSQKDGKLHACAMDYEHVALAEIYFNSPAPDTTALIEVDLGLLLTALRDAPPVVDKESCISLELDQKTITVKALEDNCITYVNKIPVEEDTGADRRIKVPAQATHLLSKYQIDNLDLAVILQDLKKINNIKPYAGHVTLKSDVQEYLTLHAVHEQYSRKETQSCTINHKLVDTRIHSIGGDFKPFEVGYSVEKLIPVLASLCKVFAKGLLLFAEDKPLSLEGKSEHVGVCYYLAPRVEN